MKEKILEAITNIEKNIHCKVLFVCESGSRAWGFESPDSDYDVRFIYYHVLSWYLDINNYPDSVEKMLPGDLDLSGWELKKALDLFAGCNLALYEWLGSDIVYYSEPGFRDKLVKLIPDYFNARKAVHHYLSIAEKTLDANPLGIPVKIKKLFYILRPLLACRFIWEENRMPSTSFQELVSWYDNGLFSSEIAELLNEKSTAEEGYAITVNKFFTEWIYDSIDFIKNRTEKIMPPAKSDKEPLNKIINYWITKGF